MKRTKKQRSGKGRAAVKSGLSTLLNEVVNAVGKKKGDQPKFDASYNRDFTVSAKKIKRGNGPSNNKVNNILLLAGAAMGLYYVTQKM